MKLKLTIAFMACALSLGACQSAEKKDARQYKYFCTMDTGVGSDKPGVCSKCGMELVEREK
jgi:hypothetical protein